MTPRLLASLGASLLLFAGSPSAQTCGPFNISVTNAGPGCAPFGGAAPILSAGLGLSPAGVCRIPFTLQMPLTLFAQPRPVLLALGLTNPSLPLGGLGLPGCTLHATPTAVAAMTIAGSNNLIYVNVLQVPQDPALVGTTVFAQALALPGAASGSEVAFSNGTAVAL